MLATKGAISKEMSKSDVYMKRKRRETAEVHQNGVPWYCFDCFCFAFSGVLWFHTDTTCIFLGVSSFSLWWVCISRTACFLISLRAFLVHTIVQQQISISIQEMTVLYTLFFLKCALFDPVNVSAPATREM